MKTLLKASMLALVAVLALGTMAGAAEMSGKVQAVDPGGKSITLDNGATLMIPASAKVDKKALTPGTDVKVRYDEKGGQKMDNSLQVSK
jgi:hypothetical protein